MLYRSMSIWARRPEGLYRYRVLENLDTGLFSVQNRDFFGESAVPLNLSRDLDQIFLELLIDQAPEERCGKPSRTVHEAIEEYDRLEAGEQEPGE